MRLVINNNRRVYIYILTFSVVLVPLVVNSVYYVPQLFILLLSPFLLINEKFNKYDRIPFFLILAILMTGLTHPSEFRISTVGYSVLCVLSFIHYVKTLNKSSFTSTQFQRLTKGIIIAFGVVLAIQLASRLAGVYVINASYNTAGKMKLNSLAFEASHIGPIITILMYAYIKMEEQLVGRKLKISDMINNRNRKVFLLYVFSCVFSFSVTCFLSLFVLLLYFFSIRHIISGGVLLLLGVVGFFSMGTEAGNRILELVRVLPSLDVKTIFAVDPSATARIAPVLVLFQEFDLSSLNTWFGYGCDYGSTHIWHMMVGEDTTEGSMAVAGIIGFIYDYGLVAFLLFLRFIRSLCRFNSFVFLIYLTCFFLGGFNWGATWLFFIVVYTLNYFKYPYNEENDFNNNCHIQRGINTSTVLR